MDVEGISEVFRRNNFNEDTNLSSEGISKISCLQHKEAKIKEEKVETEETKDKEKESIEFVKYSPLTQPTTKNKCKTNSSGINSLQTENKDQDKTPKRNEIKASGPEVVIDLKTFSKNPKEKYQYLQCDEETVKPYTKPVIKKFIRSERK